MDWKAEKERKRLERSARQFARVMASPVSRGESAEREADLLAKITSVALAIEALEGVLIKKGLLVENEVMTAMRQLIQEKHEQVKAQTAVEKGPQIVEAT